MWRLVRWTVGVGASQALTLTILDWLIPGFDLHLIESAILAGLSIAIAIALTWPVIYWIAHRFHPLLFPLISFVLTAGVVLVSARFVNVIDPDAIYLDGFWPALFVALGLTFGNTLIGALFALNDDQAYERFVLSPLARGYRGTERSDRPGFIFIEIDGLALPILERAMNEGYMPTLKRWAERGSHRLIGWEPDLSSQTSASQAGILLGDNTDIPAFRWWDKARGMPAVYCTFFAYDEVAHHSGIDRTDSFKVLRKLDQVIARFERVAEDSPRPYHLIVLSDHGQSQGATFRQRYGQTLGELVDQLTAGVKVHSPETVDEGVGGLSAALIEAIQQDSRTARLVRRALRSEMQGGEGVLNPEGNDTRQEIPADGHAAGAVVLASGNLGLISFPNRPERMTFEQITDQFPALVPELVRHPGISFVLVHSEDDGGLVIGSHGIYFLDHGYASGDDPLATFGPNAADHLRRTDRFTTAPDILAISMFDPSTGEVAAFEELVGSHGGLGGAQTEPFLLYPASMPLDPDDPIVGAASLHRVLKRWIEDARPSIIPSSRMETNLTPTDAMESA